jgi:hypothetical protein
MEINMFAKIKKLFKSIGKCCRPNCQNSAAVFGTCEECIHEEWTQMGERREDEECQRLIKAFTRAILELEQEKQQKSAIP